ncbi:hypothetical protein DH2020_035107 [Rehmannia glutinosa]|uniref:BZIP domain-containing protein n=1 Tax=Rehmannia glutinosa TaxID=99300 RepID=A0ABR0V7J9_REHGL
MGSTNIVEVPQYSLLVKQGSTCNHTLIDEYFKPINNLDDYSSSSLSSCSPPIIFNGNLNISIDHDVTNDMAHANAIATSLRPQDVNMKISNINQLEEYLIQTGSRIIFDEKAGFVENLMAKNDQYMVRQWQHQELLMPLLMPPESINCFENYKVVMEKQLLKMSSTHVPTVEQAKCCVDEKIMRVEKMAKTVERRQTRMIKNRESAARSRARKQAYTNQLLHNALQLQATNNWLKKRKIQSDYNWDCAISPELLTKTGEVR